ncbi:hypothetical protein COV49_01060 [Candidatus Falkowbacteria bacterium CG11_big_fil_rev_8_21_14_0_20_39_10]|uniref:Thioredoxin domain-containing protein n=1 Tax=Candidatus Falkowbacteria bacterium CG11_big_fil_rev_8_21_14_0_20_39_10 TaxID=1974570 RepID=A0A2M6K9R9_9BACT|nr:MAG: hypothetical protein COV49_01060 [Candidatus Falkowbacteria bacterium CG11_big_fil_rev_8_21_14_0_20_39_10]
MSKLLKFTIPFLFLIFLIKPALAQDQANLYFFYGDGCPHCAKEEIFLDKLEKENQKIKIYRYEVWRNRENAKLLSEAAKKLDIKVSGVPVLIIGDEAIVGYLSDETTGQKIRRAINSNLDNSCQDLIGSIVNKEEIQNQCVHGCGQGNEECLHNCGCLADVSKNSEIPETLNLPLIGEIKIKNISLPVLTILIGGLDGFNPCAMWVLLFLISLLLNMKNRKRMWILGGAFVVASGAVYFLFLAAWLNLFLFLGFIFWIRVLVGIFALASGGYHLKEYWTNRKGTCEVIKEDKRKKMFNRLRDIVKMDNLWIALGGIIILAAAVNLVELVCSAGLPAVYTQVLALAKLPAWQYYGYLLLYILIFMLDDLLIFIIAMSTLKMKAVGSKYARASRLIGGIIMLLIGILLIFKPGWLMF